MRRLQVSTAGAWESRMQVAQIIGCGATKLYLCARPTPGGAFALQARQLYALLDRMLQERELSRRHIITEKIFLADLAGHFESLQREREAFYAVEGPCRPASTYLQQPPCRPGVLCELQARVIFSSEAGTLQVRELPGDLGAGAGKIVSYRGYDHIYVHNLSGGRPGDGLSYGAQMEQAFERAAQVLGMQGLRFGQVIRTWIYLRDIERDYGELNRVRNAFFARRRVQRPPASTGIQGGIHPLDRGGALDLYALRTRRPVRVEVMCAPTLNEASEYGSSFSRGLAVTREDRTVAYVSGTASIDARGRVAHPGDIEGQVGRMLFNVERLLAGSGATPGDIVRATTYLKRAEDLECFRRLWRARGFPEATPHTVCRAQVCRPEWLCEIEVAAIFQPRPRRP